MSVTVDLNGKLVRVDVEFRDAEGAPVAGPADDGTNYVWSLGLDGGDAVVSIDTTGEFVKLVPVKAGTDTLTLEVTLESSTVLTGTLEVTVTPEDPVSVHLTGTVIDA